MRNYFEFENRAKINCGEDAAKTLGAELVRYGAKKPFVLFSIDAVRSGVADRALSSIRGGRKGSAVCFDGVPNAFDKEIARDMKASFQKHECDAIVAVGGAFVLDYAKVLKLFLLQKCDDLIPLAGTYKAVGDAIPMFFLPTELSLGAELNGSVTDGDTYVSSPEMVPTVLFIDRDFAEKKPLRSLAEGSIYALANAIEAYLGAEEDDPAEIYAEKAIRLLFKHGVKAAERAGNKEAATGVALASALAGVAFGNVPFGAAHALSDAISEITGVSKPQAMTLAFIAALKNLDENSVRRLENLVKTLNLEEEVAKTQEENELASEFESSQKEQGAVAILERWVDALSDVAGVTTKISQTDIQRETFGDIASSAQGKRAAIGGVRTLSKEDFIAILNNAY